MQKNHKNYSKITGTSEREEYFIVLLYLNLIEVTTLILSLNFSKT